MSDQKKKRPEALGNVVAEWLRSSGLSERVDQAAVIPEWPSLVGPQIAAVTRPKSITANGTLFVALRCLHGSVTFDRLAPRPLSGFIWAVFSG